MSEFEENTNDRNVIWEPITPEPIPQWYLNFLTFDDNDQIEPTGLVLGNNEYPERPNIDDSSLEEKTSQEDWDSMSGSSEFTEGSVGERGKIKEWEDKRKELKTPVIQSTLFFQPKTSIRRFNSVFPLPYSWFRKIKDGIKLYPTIKQAFKLIKTNSIDHYTEKDSLKSGLLGR